jgi:hypothetical protein
MVVMMIVCLAGRHYIKQYTGNMSAETFKKNFLQFDLDHYNFKLATWGEVINEAKKPRRRI